jgi:hypothetical protein
LESAAPVLEKAGALQSTEGVERFVASCRKLRFWDRTAKIKQL